MASDLTLENVIEQRNTTRIFSDREVAKNDIEFLLKAGVMAPYGGATGIPLKDIRKIIVLRKGTESYNKAYRILLNQTRKNSRKLSYFSLFFRRLEKR